MRDQLPGPVRWARILIFVIAGLTFATSAIAALRVGLSPAGVGHVLLASTSGAAQLILGLLVRRGGGAVLATVIAVQVLTMATTLLMAGQYASLSQMVLPAVVVVLVLTPTARGYFLRS